MLDRVMKIIERVRDSMIRSQVFFSIMLMVTRIKQKIHATVHRRQYTVLSGKNQNLKC